MQIREHIAKAIEEADNLSCPDGYAAQAGFGDHDWLSDWGAFLADRVIKELEMHGLTIGQKQIGRQPRWVTDYEKQLDSDTGPSGVDTLWHKRYPLKGEEDDQR